MSAGIKLADRKATVPRLVKAVVVTVTIASSPLILIFFHVDSEQT